VTSAGSFYHNYLEKLQVLSLSLDNAKPILRFPSERIPPCVLFWVSTFGFLMQKRWTMSRYPQDSPITSMLHFLRVKKKILVDNTLSKKS
jgi:hypothetical protein